MSYCVLSLLACYAATAGPLAVFNSGEDGYNTYRIPAIVQAPSGTLLAFCEGRVNDMSDAGNIDLVLKRSTDGGASWGPLELVADCGGDTIGNPAPVFDRHNGRLHLLLTRNARDAKEPAILAGKASRRTVWQMTSGDEGKTWSALREITEQASRPEWRWYATGPCNAVQLKDGTLAIPCNHSTGPAPRTFNTHVILSSDGGETWRIGGLHQGYVNESTLVELGDGRLYQNMRNYRKTARRAVSYSSDGGKTWSDDTDDPALIEPVCQASAIGVPDAVAKSGIAILFSNPAHEKKRENMTVRISRDMGKSWETVAVLHPGPTAYSNLVYVGEGMAGCLYEAGEKNPYEGIRFAQIPLPH